MYHEYIHDIFVQAEVFQLRHQGLLIIFARAESKLVQLYTYTSVGIYII